MAERDMPSIEHRIEISNAASSESDQICEGGHGGSAKTLRRLLIRPQDLLVGAISEGSHERVQTPNVPGPVRPKYGSALIVSGSANLKVTTRILTTSVYSQLELTTAITTTSIIVRQYGKLEGHRREKIKDFKSNSAMIHRKMVKVLL